MKHHYPNCDLGDKCRCDATDDFLDTFTASSDAVETAPVAKLPANPQLLSEGLRGEAAGAEISSDNAIGEARADSATPLPPTTL